MTTQELETQVQGLRRQLRWMQPCAPPSMPPLMPSVSGKRRPFFVVGWSMNLNELVAAKPAPQPPTRPAPPQPAPRPAPQAHPQARRRD